MKTTKAAKLVLILTVLILDIAHAVTLNDVMKKHWYDGNAELNSYDLRFVRYGEERQGTAVAIFVTEPFHLNTLVKSNTSQGKDIVQVMKLNLIEDFPTGIYDYNLMTSVFAPFDSEIIPSPLKINFSSQEWCGQTFSELLFRKANIDHSGHSYFEGEANQTSEISYPDKTWLSEDALLLWARGWIAPKLEAGKKEKIKLLSSAKISRLAHTPIAWYDAEISKSANAELIKVSAGKFSVDVYEVSISLGRKHRIYVERASPEKIIKWEVIDKNLSQKTELIASKRMQYWQLNDTKSIGLLKDLGLSRRPARTP